MCESFCLLFLYLDNVTIIFWPKTGHRFSFRLTINFILTILKSNIWRFHHTTVYLILCTILVCLGAFVFLLTLLLNVVTCRPNLSVISKNGTFLRQRDTQGKNSMVLFKTGCLVTLSILISYRLVRSILIYVPYFIISII